jgi:hypothetical protein
MCRLLGYCSRGSASAANLLTEQGLRDLTALSAFHSDGWGMAWYNHDGPEISKSTRRAVDEPDYDRLAHRALGDIGLVHLRWATPGLADRPGFLTGLTGVISTLGRQARRSPGWHPHTDPGAIVAEEGQGDSRDAGVVDVPDGIPGFCRHARLGDVIGDDPEGQDIRDALVAGKAAPQLQARFDAGECAERRRGAVLMHRCGADPMCRCGAVLMRRWPRVAAAAHG